MKKKNDQKYYIDKYNNETLFILNTSYRDMYVYVCVNIDL